MPKTVKKIADKLVIGLQRLGWVEGKRLTRYRTFTSEGGIGTVYVGEAGALRVSRTNKVTETAKATDTFREAVLYAFEHPDPEPKA